THYARAARLDEGDCEAGSAPACYELAGFYKAERPIRKDTRAVVRWLDRGCTLGSPPACHDLAHVYQWGSEPVTPDQARALLLYKKACTMEHVEACERAGQL